MYIKTTTVPFTVHCVPRLCRLTYFLNSLNFNTEKVKLIILYEILSKKTDMVYLKRKYCQDPAAILSFITLNLMGKINICDFKTRIQRICINSDLVSTNYFHRIT